VADAFDPLEACRAAGRLGIRSLALARRRDPLCETTVARRRRIGRARRAVLVRILRLVLTLFTFTNLGKTTRRSRFRLRLLYSPLYQILGLRVNPPQSAHCKPLDQNAPDAGRRLSGLGRHGAQLALRPLFRPQNEPKTNLEFSKLLIQKSLLASPLFLIILLFSTRSVASLCPENCNAFILRDLLASFPPYIRL